MGKVRGEPVQPTPNGVTEMGLSTYQTAIINEIIAGTSNIVVDAKAGAGKSFTIMQSLKALKEAGFRKQCLLMAFNKNIQKELEAKVSDLGASNFVTVKTFHSVGFSALRSINKGRRVKVDSRKSWKILKNWKDNETITKDDYKMCSTILKLVGLAKNAGVKCTIDGVMIHNNKALYEGIVDHHGITPSSKDGSIDRAIELAMLLVEKAAITKDIIDFDDMLWMPIMENARFYRNNRVMVDELQDTNPLQLEIAARALASNGQFVGVGDPNQAIYGFRGADSDAFWTVADRMSAKVMSLPICYRCPTSVIDEAQTLVPEIQASPNAIEGSVETFGEDPNFDVTQFDAILCRNNAPLVKACYTFIRKRIPAFILGKDTAKSLCYLIDTMEALTIDELETALEAYFQREIGKAKEKGHQTKAGLLTDKQECLAVFFEMLPENSRTIAGLKRQIESLFSDKNEDGILLSTIHKCKGREWNTVGVLDRHLMPSKYAIKDWQKQQEANLEYVAITRAMERLVWVHTEDLVEL
jgi:superfamily I DNA/RNA helicase